MLNSIPLEHSLSPVSQTLSPAAATLTLATMVTRSQPHTLTEKYVQLVIATGMSDRIVAAKDFDAMKAAAKCLQAFISATSATNTPTTTVVLDSALIHRAMQLAIPFLSTVISGACCDENEVSTRCVQFCMFIITWYHTLM